MNNVISAHMLFGFSPVDHLFAALDGRLASLRGMALPAAKAAARRIRAEIVATVPAQHRHHAPSIRIATARGAVTV